MRRTNFPSCCGAIILSQFPWQWQEDRQTAKELIDKVKELLENNYAPTYIAITSPSQGPVNKAFKKAKFQKIPIWGRFGRLYLWVKTRRYT